MSTLNHHKCKTKIDNLIKKAKESSLKRKIDVDYIDQLDDDVKLQLVADSYRRYVRLMEDMKDISSMVEDLGDVKRLIEIAHYNFVYEIDIELDNFETRIENYIRANNIYRSMGHTRAIHSAVSKLDRKSVV